MMRSLFSGVAGLKSHQTRMDVIGNNIANVNTVGFKSNRVTFADTLYQTNSGASAPTDNKGGTNPKQIGLGTGVASIDTIFTDGSVQSTGKNTDLCLSGSGLFIVKDASGTYYTRDGAFEYDAEGNYVLPGSGHYVQGWMGSDGVVDTTGTVGNITIPNGKSMAAEATATAAYTNNLNSAAPTIASMMQGGNPITTGTASTGSPITMTMSDGSKVTQTSGTYKTGNSLPVATTLTVYDTLGNAHTVSITLTKTKTDSTNGNQWTAALATTSIKEDDGTTTNLGMSDVTIQFDTSGVCKSGNGTLTMTYANGAKDASGSQKVSIDFTQLTQFSGSSTVKGDADGHAAGTLKSLAVDSSGIITGTYTNGVIQSEAQVAIAQFNNSTGLTKTGTNLYQESNNSGTPNVHTATDLGVTITPSSLEMSNVDIANEFSDMIITQRGFQSNSKIITVGDEMLETVINMKR